MKKVMIFLLVIVMVMALAACGAKEEKPAQIIESTEAKPTETTMATETEPATTMAAVEKEPIITLEAKDCFYDAGFVEIISWSEATVEFTFTAENSEGVEWWVYVLEEAFDDGLRYIKQVAEPVLMGDGTISVEEGQYVYVYCSANEFTTGVVDENAKLNIFVK